MTPLEAALALLRDYEDFPRTIDRNGLAERVLSGGVVHQHEREFIADWLRGKKKQNHRPPSFETAVASDAIARAVFFSRATGQRLSQKKIGNAFGVSARTVRMAVEVSPERKKSLEAWAADLAASGGTIANVAELLMQIKKEEVK